MIRTVVGQLVQYSSWIAPLLVFTFSVSCLVTYIQYLNERRKKDGDSGTGTNTD